ncbi:MAG: InlB B-repeat-containing protein [Bacilli bacterium]
MKKLSIIICSFLCILGIVSCKEKTKDPIKHNIEYVLDGGINNPNNPTEYEEGKEVVLLDPTKDNYNFVGWFIDDNKIEVISKDQKTDLVLTAKWQLKITPPVYDTKITISGPTEVRSGNTIKLVATVTDAPDTSVIWEITSGQEYATIASDGTLTAKEVTGDKVIEVTAKSSYNPQITNKVSILITAKAVLTSEMLDTLKIDKIGYIGYVNVKLYSVGLFEKLESTYTYNTKTAMDGVNWYTEYEDGNTGLTLGLYYKNHNNLACQVGVNFMNEEEYEPMIDDDGNTVSWEESGLYNNFKNLQVSDFTYNEVTNRYDYSGNDDKMAEKMISSANPYTFIANGFSLIIEDGEIIGIYAKSGADYTISSGYKAIQELIVTINYGDTVEVPTISKYQHIEEHDILQTAIDNMRNLSNYTLHFREITATYLTSGYKESGFHEIITDSNCYFDPYTVSYQQDGTDIENYSSNDSYGYKKITNELYNSYYQNEDGSYTASRAYNSEFQNAKPSFGFVAEIFTSYYLDPTDGSYTFYADEVMSSVASTFYCGVGNDISLYGIFATRGHTSSTSSFTPYVVVKDGYITEACFYFYLGSIYGVVEITYSDYNNSVVPEDANVDFVTRNVPTSWSELTFIVNDISGSGTESEVNALEYLKTLYDDENIEEVMPFFGVPLGDTFGFGMTTIHIPTGSDTSKSAVLLYYDVPLDIDYTIESSLAKIEEYLVGLGFTKNKNGEFNKGDIWVAPMDVSLDLQIYIWRA